MKSTREPIEMTAKAPSRRRRRPNERQVALQKERVQRRLEERKDNLRKCFNHAAQWAKDISATLKEGADRAEQLVQDRAASVLQATAYFEAFLEEEREAEEKENYEQQEQPAQLQAIAEDKEDIPSPSPSANHQREFSAAAAASAIHPVCAAPTSTMPPPLQSVLPNPDRTVKQDDTHLKMSTSAELSAAERERFYDKIIDDMKDNRPCAFWSQEAFNRIARRWKDELYARLLVRVNALNTYAEKRALLLSAFDNRQTTFGRIFEVKRGIGQYFTCRLFSSKADGLFTKIKWHADGYAPPEEKNRALMLNMKQLGY
jgi:hypothetical protein